MNNNKGRRKKVPNNSMTMRVRQSSKGMNMMNRGIMIVLNRGSMIVLNRSSMKVMNRGSQKMIHNSLFKNSSLLKRNNKLKNKRGKVTRVKVPCPLLQKSPSPEQQRRGCLEL